MSTFDTCPPYLRAYEKGHYIGQWVKDMFITLDKRSALSNSRNLLTRNHPHPHSSQSPIISHQEEGTTHRAARLVTPRPAHAATPSATPTAAATAAATTWRGAALPSGAAPAVASTRHGDTVGGNTASWARRRGTSWAKTAGEAVLNSFDVRKRLTKQKKKLSNIRANQCKRMWDVVFFPGEL